MSRFRAETKLDRAFEVMLVVKGLDGLLEVGGGLILLLVPAATLNAFLTTITQHELSEDPNDILITRRFPWGNGSSVPRQPSLAPTGCFMASRSWCWSAPSSRIDFGPTRG
jgi:hypothetical protein